MALGALALAGSGLHVEPAASLLTALGCLTLGAAIVRLTPGRWLRLGVLAMAAVDVILLAVGIGQPAATLLHEASAGLRPVFHRAQLGPMSLDYPDLVLARAHLSCRFATRPERCNRDDRRLLSRDRAARLNIASAAA